MSLSMTEFEEIQRSAKERDDIVAKYDLGREEGAQIDPWEDPAFEVYHVTDRYGFIHPRGDATSVGRKVSTSSLNSTDNPSQGSDDLTSHRTQESALKSSRGTHTNQPVHNKQVEKERTTKWLKMIKSWDKYYPGEKMTRRVYKGIPDCLRGEVWSKLLTIPKVKAEQEGVYHKMRNRARTKSTSIRQIDLDVNRTYRNHIMFRERYGVKQQALFHVLAAYSVYNTEIGYCQGMSEIAALLLMYLNEEDAFWGLSQLFISPKHMMHGFFMHGFPKLLRFQDHHDNVLRKFLPKVRRHLEKNEMSPSLYTIKWFLQCFLDRTPFHLTLRLWDIHMLDGEQILVAMAYCIIKIHRRRILKMQMDELLTFFQSGLEADFVYDSDTVIEQLQVCMEELRKSKMAVPPKPIANEQPTLPFGLEIQPSVEQLIGRRTDETMDEHFRKSVQKSAGKPAYLRRKHTGGSMTGGTNLLSTPEMARSRVETKSLQSRMSQYSIDDKSSYYDTAANSRLSLADYSTKTSAPSSRTSVGEISEVGSISGLGHGFTTPIDLDEVGVEVATPTTPTNPALPLPPYNSAPVMSQSYEMSRPFTGQQARVRTSSSLEMHPQTKTPTFEHVSRPASISQSVAKTTPSPSYHSSPNTPIKNHFHPPTNNMTDMRSYEYDDTPVSFSHEFSSVSRGAVDAAESSPAYRVSEARLSGGVDGIILPITRVAGKVPTEDSESTKSASSDYDNINGMYDAGASTDISAKFAQGHGVTVIPISRSEGFVSRSQDAEMVLLNGSDGHLTTQMKLTRVENDVQQMHQRDHTDQRTQDFQNGFQVQQQTSYQVSQATTAHTRLVYSRVVEKSAYL